MYGRSIFSEKVLNGIVALMVLFVLSYRCMIAFSYAPELVNGESNNIWNAIKVNRDLPIYSDPEALPLEIFQYTPLSQLPIIIAAGAFDASDSNYVHNITVVGRLVSLVLNMLTLLMLFLACRLLVTTDRWVIAMGCMLGFMSFTHSSFAIRPDATAFFLMMTAFYLFAKYTASEKTWYLFLSASVLALAFMAKQDAMVIVAPLSLTLLLQRKWKQLVLFDFVFISMLAAMVLLGHALLGPFFLTSVVNGVRNPSALQQMLAVLLRFIDLYPFHFLAANTAIAVVIWHHRSRPELLLLALTTLFFEVFAMMTSAKIGSWVNYYTPFLLFSSVLVIIMLTDYVKQSRSLARHRSLLLVMLVAGIFIFRQTYAFTAPFLKYGTAKAHYADQWKDLQQLRNELHLMPDDRIMVVDPLTRIMLAHHTIIPNIEYYGISPFDYSQFRKGAADKVDHILFAPSDKASIRNLMQFFHIDASQFAEIETTTGFMILSRQAQ
jgi:hypothetical protein